jgi:hypothetical protein
MLNLNVQMALDGAGVEFDASPFRILRLFRLLQLERHIRYVHSHMPPIYTCSRLGTRVRATKWALPHAKAKLNARESAHSGDTKRRRCAARVPCAPYVMRVRAPLTLPPCGVPPTSRHPTSAFTLLDDVWRGAKGVLKAAGLLALILWVGSATLFFLTEQVGAVLYGCCCGAGAVGVTRVFSLGVQGMQHRICKRVYARV